jgi:hypothetical protein
MKPKKFGAAEPAVCVVLRRPRETRFICNYPDLPTSIARRHASHWIAR